MRIQFQNEFVWGTATAAYQVEGAWNLDGRGESIWDRFSHTPGYVENNQNGDVACDQYHRFKDDIALMSAMNIPAYRFSVSWPRIYPAGKGDVNQPGLDYYDKLVDALLEKNIEPWLTLYHWDLPQKLQDLGGWPNRDVADYFAEYTKTMVELLGDRVRYWMTFNEPWVTAFLGHKHGIFAPGVKNVKQAYQTAYHLMLAHGKAYGVIKSKQPDVKVGYTHIYMNLINCTRDQISQDYINFMENEYNHIFLDPVTKGTYPEAICQKLGKDAPDVRPEDLKVMNQYDFIGLQYYNDRLVMHGVEDDSNPDIPVQEFTQMGWPITPYGFYESIMAMQNQYQAKEIVITENGSAWPDTLSHDGKVFDDKRQKFMKEHLYQLHRAITAGANVTGYFAWSLMDNFEWASGYRPRFGIVYVDYPTQKRYIKESGYLFSQIIKENGFDVEF